MTKKWMTKERQIMLECIHLYRDMPTLWNLKSKVYYDRAKKDKAYTTLLNKYREWYPEASRDDVKRKFNILRTNYRKELKKRVESAKTGTVYEPSLWYFKEFAFLNKKKSYALNPSMDVASVIDPYVDEEQSTATRSHASTSATTQHSPSHRITARIVKNAYVNKKDENNIMNLECEKHSDNKDEYYHWAMSCAADIRKMERTQQLFAKKAIADIIMEGQLGMLHRHSVKVNESNVNNESSQLSTPTSSNILYPTKMEQGLHDLDCKGFVRHAEEGDETFFIVEQ